MEYRVYSCPKFISTFLILIGLCFLNDLFAAETEPSSTPSINTCKTITGTVRGIGIEYKGQVSNGDYRFSVYVPSGLVGRGEINPNVPFHGFTIFLENQCSECSCIHFEISHEVILPEDLELNKNGPPLKTKRVKVGNKTGRLSSDQGISTDGIEYENVTVFLTLPRKGYNNVAAITLVTPMKNREKTNRIFKQFLDSFNFW
jgi:hypothetical protein